MKKFILLFLLLLFNGCRMLKNTTKTNDQQHLSTSLKSALAIKEQKDWSKNSASLLFYRDSAKRDYVLQLWPKGLFSYSAEKGFIGEADSMIIKSWSAKGKTFVQNDNMAEQDNGKKSVSVIAQEKLVRDQGHKVSRETLSWKVIIASLVVIGLITWLIFRNLKN